ncbi:hypothetical protein [Actinoplanes derwentensis]|uniref:hypothetical protein n=1 Tax=Actinoplanes derwentensis TaxID=113562 RepID=UPI000B8631F6|nr:hypothetical protein [Actinoplanes derwentensis]GID82376.1 hypothetical protein Ade03nite_13000 [Actinoplanes derwentensis]
MVAPNWPIIQPASTGEIIELSRGPRQRIIVWLDEIEQFFDTEPQLTREHVLRLLPSPAIVVATMWPTDFTTWKPSRHPADFRGNSRLLGLATKIVVPDELSPGEQANADKVAKTDSRIRLALEIKDAGLTQALAAGPDLLYRWQLAPAYARSVINFAADARRLGIRTPIPRDCFVEAVGGYLTPTQRVNRPSWWLDEALAFGEEEVRGGVSTLAPADEGGAGHRTGHVVADYVAQHIRRDKCPPQSAWNALIATAGNPDDLRRLALAANTRMRYCHEEHALRRLYDRHGEGVAELADLLFRSGRDQEAIMLLSQHVLDDPEDGSATALLEDITALAPRIGALRAASAVGDRRAARHLAELFADNGEADWLRTRANGGNKQSEKYLAELLADRGAVAELRERADLGKKPAACALAELLAAHAQEAQLRKRANAGDRAAHRQLKKLLASGAATDGTAIQAQVSDLRRRIADGDEDAGRQLTTLLFELRNEDELRREVDAGTFQAAERLVALLNARENDPVGVDRLRAHGLTADGSPYQPWET